MKSLITSGILCNYRFSQIFHEMTVTVCVQGFQEHLNLLPPSLQSRCLIDQRTCVADGGVMITKRYFFTHSPSRDLYKLTGSKSTFSLLL